MGALEIANLPAHVPDASRFASVFPGREVRGAIGTRLLMPFLPTIDYVRGRCQRNLPAVALTLAFSAMRMVISPQ